LKTWVVEENKITA